MFRWPRFTLSEISAGDFDVAVIGQLPLPNLALGDQFEPGPVEMISFEAALGCRGLGQQDLENAPGNPNDAIVFTNLDAELDDGAIGIPTGIRRETEEHEPPTMFCQCSVKHIVLARRNVEPFRG
jgi:hypothetical protein